MIFWLVLKQVYYILYIITNVVCVRLCSKRCIRPSVRPSSILLARIITNLVEFKVMGIT
jgi:hypothetical protein